MATSIKPLVIAWEIKLKLGVSPLIIIPIATKPSYFFMFLDIDTGISKAPFTEIVSKDIFFCSKIKEADLNNW